MPPSMGGGTVPAVCLQAAPPHLTEYQSRAYGRAARRTPDSSGLEEPRTDAPLRAAIMVNTIASVLTQKGAAVWFLSPGASVYEAIEKMAEKGVGALLVMEEERLVGVVSERDYARKVILKGRLSRETGVAELRSISVIRVRWPLSRT